MSLKPQWSGEINLGHVCIVVSGIVSLTLAYGNLVGRISVLDAMYQANVQRIADTRINQGEFQAEMRLRLQRIEEKLDHKEDKRANSN